MPALFLPEIPPLLVIAVAPPMLIWIWGRALEQFGVGVERVAIATIRARQAVAAAREGTPVA